MKIQEKSLHEYSWYLQPIFRSQKKKYGAVLKSGLLWARLPRLFAAVSFLTGLIAFQNLSSKFNAALDIPAQGFCKVPTFK